jgi:hypothetical protein
VSLSIAPTLEFIRPVAKEAASSTFSFVSSVVKPVVQEDEVEELVKKRRLLWYLGSPEPLWKYKEEFFDEELMRKIQEKAAKGEDYFESDECAICVQDGKKPTLAFLPCRHKCAHMPPTEDCQLTMDELRKLRKCYLCRGLITAFAKDAMLQTGE